MSKLLENLITPSPTLSPVDPRGTLTKALAFAALYAGIHVVVAPVWPRVFGKEQWAKRKKKDRVYWSEKVPSSINALFVGGLAAREVFFRQVFRGDVIEPYSMAMDLALSAYSGYSLYDMGVMAIVTQEPVEMWLHHGLGVLGASAMQLYRQLAFFPVSMLITELSVLGLNLVWYLQHLPSAPPAALYSGALTFRAVSFLSLRGLIAPWALIYAAQQEGGWLRLWSRVRSCNGILATGTAANMVIFGGLNLLWTYKAVMTAVKPKTGKDGKREVGEEGEPEWKKKEEGENEAKIGKKEE